MSELTIGQKAPELSLPDQDGQTVKLADYAGRKILLYFYPKADTPGCTTQACAVRDALSELADHGVAAIGVSPDPPKKQRKFADKYALGFPLLCDTENAVAEAYGVWVEKSMYGKTYMGILRSAFLIAEDGTIAGTWYKVSPADTVPNVVTALGSE